LCAGVGSLGFRRWGSGGFFDPDGVGSFGDEGVSFFHRHPCILHKHLRAFAATPGEIVRVNLTPIRARYSSLCRRTRSNSSSANPLDRQTWDPSRWIECPSTDKMFRRTGRLWICPASGKHPNISTALKVFTISLQPKSVASHLRFIQSRMEQDFFLPIPIFGQGGTDMTHPSFVMIFIAAAILETCSPSGR